MKRISYRAVLVFLAAVALPATLSQTSSAAVFGHQLKAGPSIGSHLVRAGQCWHRVGPFMTQHRAYQMLQEARASGYATGPIYGEGGLYSNYSNRRWFFTIYYAC